MYLAHLAYLGQEALAIKDLIASIKNSPDIAAAKAAGVRVSSPFGEKIIFLQCTA
jgi:hypothetical protein